MKWRASMDFFDDSQMTQTRIIKILLFILIAFFLAGANLEFYAIADGSGAMWGAFAPSWLAFFALFLLTTLSALLAFGGYLLRPAFFLKYQAAALRLRARLGRARWGLAFLIWLLPAYVLQYTAWGAVFHGIFIRLALAALSVALMTWLFSDGDSLAAQHPFWAALTLASFGFVAAFSFSDVTNYPFSLGWSEGNRLWDYSLMFGKDRYIVADGATMKAYLEFGRQLVGAIPFLYADLTIGMERAWLALMTTLPYLLVGMALFLRGNFSTPDWLAVLWVFLFLKQGPIHPPLLFIAAGTALLWRKPLGLILPLAFALGYAARLSRSTWLFAPGIWLAMLEFSGAAWLNSKMARVAFWRAALALMFGALGGQYGGVILKFVTQIFSGAAPVVPVFSATTLAGVANSAGKQALLWERLLPSATYPIGVLPGLFVAIAPLALVLILFALRKNWTLSGWQRVGILAPLAVFLAVGLIVSVKIGGGGDLHNMDMFLIALTFTAALAWHGGGRAWLLSAEPKTPRMMFAMAALLALPAFAALHTMRPQNFMEQADWLMVLADAPNQQALNMLPASSDVEDALQTLQAEVDAAQPRGEVLFLDQRQLLTFGLIQNAPFVPEYEKKVLIDKALSSDAPYFQRFYADLAAARFALVIAPPLHRRVQGEDFIFGEENNAWIKWVSAPLLCYYERKDTLKQVGVQLLVPIIPAPNCADALPLEARTSSQP